MISGELKELLIESKKIITSIDYLNLVDESINKDDVNLKSDDKMTLLMWAVSSNKISLKLLNKLLEQGADVNYENMFYRSPLMIAVKYNMIEKVKVLLKYSPNLNLKDEYGHTILEIAQSYNFKEVEELILEKMKNNNQVTSLSDEENVINEEDYKQKLIRRFNNINARINK